MANNFLVKLTTATEGNVVSEILLVLNCNAASKLLLEETFYENLFHHKSLNNTEGKAPNNVKRARIFPCD